jgi:hypothetical protein
MVEILERKHAILVTEFDRYVIEHLGFVSRISQNAQIVLPVEGYEEYNQWSRQLAERQRETEQVVAYVKVKGLKSAKSRPIKPVLSKAAEEIGGRLTLHSKSSKPHKCTIFLPIIPAYSKGYDRNATIGGARTQTFENDF